MPIDKRALIADLRAHLASELDASQRRALDAAEAATHEENRPENDKDMRSTEASYIARGQAERVRDMEQALVVLQSLPLRDFGDADPIASSAIVDVAHRQGKTK